MHEAMLYERLADSAVRCHVRQWCCVIHLEKYGLWRVRHNRDVTLEILNYSEVPSATAVSIEKKPLFHFYPASQVFPVGDLASMAPSVASAARIKFQEVERRW